MELKNADGHEFCLLMTCIFNDRFFLGSLRRIDQTHARCKTICSVLDELLITSPIIGLSQMISTNQPKWTS